MMENRTGQCLCGTVRVAFDMPKAEFQACHCKQCQTWTGGGPFYAIRAMNVAIEGEDNLTSYCHSEWGERVSCSTCGTTITWKMQGKPPAFLAIGLLDDTSDLSLTEEIFIDQRPDWLCAIESANQSTEAEMKAQLQAYLAKQGS